MLNVGALREGYVLDHIKAGKAMTIYHDLKLDKLDCTVAIIKNARSNKMGKKDIIKVECPIEDLDLDILGFIDHNITVNIIKDEKIVETRASWYQLGGFYMPQQSAQNNCVAACCYATMRWLTGIEVPMGALFGGGAA